MHFSFSPPFFLLLFFFWKENDIYSKTWISNISGVVKGNNFSCNENEAYPISIFDTPFTNSYNSNKDNSQDISSKTQYCEYG